MAMARRGIINWSGEIMPFSNIKSSLKRSELSSKVFSFSFFSFFFNAIQLESGSAEIHGNLEVLDTGSWPQPHNWID